MTGLIKHLAAAALGRTDPNAALLSLPSRFATYSSFRTDSGAVDVEGEPSASLRPDASPQVSVRTPFSAEVRIARTTPPISEAPNTGLVPPISSERRMPPDTAAPALVQPKVYSPPVQPPAQAPKPLSTAESQAAPPRAIEAMQKVAGLASASFAAPMSAAVLASLPRPKAEDRPVIEVTIDRIDVRAPAAERPKQPTRRARPDPAQSLHEFLQAGRGRG